jgi:hypothetical protein
MIEDKNIEQAKANIPNQSSTKLAEMIVCYRYLGLYKDVSMLAMEELGKRRSDGDEFDYEDYISSKLNTLPKLTVEKPNVGSIVNLFAKYIGGAK